MASKEEKIALAEKMGWLYCKAGWNPDTLLPTWHEEGFLDKNDTTIIIPKERWKPLLIKG